MVPPSPSNLHKWRISTANVTSKIASCNHAYSSLVVTANLMRVDRFDLKDALQVTSRVTRGTASIAVYI
jgi:hypothetical protein